MNTTVTTTTFLSEKIGGGDPVPIEIGARGTVGNLVMKEIEYFRKLESRHGDVGGDHGKCSIKNSINHDQKHRGDGVGGSNFWPGFGFLSITWRRGKRKGGGSNRFLPKMCTTVDVADSRHNHHHRLSKFPSFSYRNLRDDINQFEV